MVFGCISEVEGNMVWEEGQRRGKVKCGRRLQGQVVVFVRGKRGSTGFDPVNITKGCVGFMVGLGR